MLIPELLKIQRQKPLKLCLQFSVLKYYIYSENQSKTKASWEKTASGLNIRTH
jgi:hypothetical protein